MYVKAMWSRLAAWPQRDHTVGKIRVVLMKSDVGIASYVMKSDVTREARALA